MNRYYAMGKHVKSIFLGALLLFGTGLQAQEASNTSEISKATLTSIMEKNRPYYQQGKVADYIPELGKMDAKALAFAVVDETGKLTSVGDVHKKFTMQSISKIISLVLAVMEHGEQSVFEKMGYYGTDKPFNHFANLETMGKPLNPMMNAGAILTTSLLSGSGQAPFDKILAWCASSATMRR